MDKQSAFPRERCRLFLIGSIMINPLTDIGWNLTFYHNYLNCKQRIIQNIVLLFIHPHFYLLKNNKKKLVLFFFIYIDDINRIIYLKSFFILSDFFFFSD